MDCQASRAREQESKSAVFAEKQMDIPILSCWFSSKKPHIDHSQGESILGVWGPGNFENDDVSIGLYQSGTLSLSLSGAAGRVKEKQLPPPATPELSTHICPPIAWTMSLLIYN